MVIDERFRNNTVHTTPLLTLLFIQVASQELRGHLQNIYVWLMVCTTEPEFSLGGHKEKLIPGHAGPLHLFPLEKRLLEVQEMPTRINRGPVLTLVLLQVNEGLQRLYRSRIDDNMAVRVSMHQPVVRGNALRKAILQQGSRFV